MKSEDRFRSDEPDDESDNESDNEFRESRSGQWGDPTDAPVVEVSFEELLELQEELEAEDEAMSDLIDTAHTDGSTDNVYLAMDQGLVYAPPMDPPVIPSDGSQGIEMAAGFASSIEDSDLNAEDLPDRVDDNDSDLETDILNALRYNSETSSAEHVRVYVRNGIVYLRGRVDTDDDSDIIEEIVRNIDNVKDVRNELESAD